MIRNRLNKRNRPELTPIAMVVVQAVAGSSPVAHPKALQIGGFLHI
jgi:hypothetical protein